MIGVQVRIPAGARAEIDRFLAMQEVFLSYRNNALM
jgi:hypothetical protein